MNRPDQAERGSDFSELIHNEARLRAILFGLQDQVITIDPNGIVQFASQSCLAGFGYEPDELIGRNVNLLMPEPYRSAHDGYIAKYAQTGASTVVGNKREFPVLRKDGSLILCEIVISRIDIPDARTPLFSGVLRDISDRKRVEQELERRERLFRAIFDQEFQFVGLLEPDGRIVEVNRAALDAGGAKRGEWVGRFLWDVSLWQQTPEERQRLIASVERAAQGEFVRFETTHRCADGRIIDVDFSIKPFRDEGGQVLFLLPEARDITAARQAANREISMMRSFAEIGESAALLAHEIKSPITAVNCALRAVAKQLGADESAILQELVERMQKLEKLMRRTLTLARPIEQHPELCEPSELLRTAAEFMRPLLAERDVVLEIHAAPECPRIEVDIGLFDEVLTNLIRNALDATAPGGRIRLSAAAEDQQVVLRIEDDGPGIPEAVLITLFKPFVSTKTNGTGLGLAIARKVVEAHGGTIEVRSSPLGGALFEIRICARLQPAAASTGR